MIVPLGQPSPRMHDQETVNEGLRYMLQDAGIGFCVALEKQDFIGKAALAGIKAEGPRWKLCSFTIDAGRPLTRASIKPCAAR